MRWKGARLSSAANLTTLEQGSALLDFTLTARLHLLREFSFLCMTLHDSRVVLYSVYTCNQGRCRPRYARCCWRLTGGIPISRTAQLCRSLPARLPDMSGINIRPFDVANMETVTYLVIVREDEFMT